MITTETGGGKFRIRIISDNFAFCTIIERFNLPHCPSTLFLTLFGCITEFAYCIVDVV